MKRILTTIILCATFVVSTIAQKNDGWSPSILIATSNVTGRSTPDYCIDNNGKIHVVWSYHYESKGPFNYTLNYCFSTDNGNTWSPVQHILQDTVVGFVDPKIITDSENNIHVLCTKIKGYSQKPTYLSANSTGEWQTSIDLTSTPMNRAWDIAIDKNDKIYTFFNCCVNKLAYKTLYNDMWSSIRYIYDTTNSHEYTISDTQIASNGDVLCVGSHTPNHGTLIWNTRAAVMRYNSALDEWMPVKRIGQHTKINLAKLALKNNNADSIYVVRTEHSPNEVYIKSRVAHTNESMEYEDEVICTQSYQNSDIHPDIASDSYGQLHVVQQEKINGRHIHVHYRLVNNQWVGTIVESSLTNGCLRSKLISHDGYLYWLYLSGTRIYLRRYEEQNESVPEEMNALSQVQLLPNPVASSCQFSYHLAAASSVNIQLYNSQGQAVCTIYNGQQPAGQQQIEWDAQGLSAGIYFVRLQAGKYVINAKLVKA